MFAWQTELCFDSVSGWFRFCWFKASFLAKPPLRAGIVTTVLVLAASTAMSLVEMLPNKKVLRSLDEVHLRTRRLLREGNGEGSALYVAVRERPAGEGLKSAIDIVRQFGPHGITTKAPKAAKNRPMDRKADTSTRLLVRVGRAFQQPFTMSVSEAAVSYDVVHDGIPLLDPSATPWKVDIRIVQLVRDVGEMLAQRAWSSDGNCKPEVHVSSALLLQKLGIGSNESGPVTDCTRLAQFLSVFVWAATLCIFADIKTLDPNRTHAWPLACATAVVRAWELYFHCRRCSWPQCDDAEVAYMSVLACLPNAVSRWQSQHFEAGQFEECLGQVRVRVQGETDTRLPRTPDKVRCRMICVDSMSNSLLGC